ncbi:orexin/Hypocretin receptor type 1-like [Littorina saxatilis]|uniref:orexin/Hypocretin receptor type 1-like n=1 Tax=Littorina saxatilis TaxID=31220 RepID=UPI0038B4E861
MTATSETISKTSDAMETSSQCTDASLKCQSPLPSSHIDAGYSDSESDTDAFLHAKDLGLVSALVPFIAYIVLLIVVGLVGNTTVFLVYFRRFKPSVTRTYILAMSVCDLLVNVLILPADILEIRFYHTFRAEWACKTTRSTRLFLSVFSGLILVAVAVTRRKTVCQATARRPVTFKAVLLSMVACGMISLALAVPYSVLVGSRTRTFASTNITGIGCGFADIYHKSPFLRGFNATLNILYVVCALTLAISYIQIALFLRRHKTRRGRNAPSIRRRDNQSTDEEDSSSENRTESQEEPNAMGMKTVHDEQDTANVNTIQITATDCEADSDRSVVLLRVTIPTQVSQGEGLCENRQKTQTVSTVKIRPQQRKLPTRTTFMLFVLTMIFTLNYVPYLAIIGVETVKPGFFEALEPNLYFICSRSFLLNSVVNPIIYSLCSAKVRYEIAGLLRSCKSH